MLHVRKIEHGAEQSHFIKLSDDICIVERLNEPLCIGLIFAVADKGQPSGNSHDRFYLSTQKDHLSGMLNAVAHITSDSQG